tara:strand:+ start:128 stop:253 length:126 start_codon:yes stop_codon:yes gene_type:complete
MFGSTIINKEIERFEKILKNLKKDKVKNQKIDKNIKKQKNK